jgi:hypothetical protein
MAIVRLETLGKMKKKQKTKKQWSRREWNPALPKILQEKRGIKY